MRLLPNLDSLTKYLQQNFDDIFLIIHPQADPDAIGAVIGINALIRYYNPKVKIFLLKNSFNHLGERIFHESELKIDLIFENEIPLQGLIILLDTPQIIPETIDPKNKLIIIDHHIKQDLLFPIEFDFRAESFYSTTEIITSIFYHDKIPLNASVRKALLAGLLFDTQRFLHADSNVFHAVMFLIQENFKIYQETLNLLLFDREFSEKRACIRGAQRMKLVKISNFDFLFTHVSSFEAAVARALLRLGGDVAIVISIHKYETRISLRASSQFILETGISLGKDIIPVLVSDYGGIGGGHDGAAGYNNKKKLGINEVKTKIINLFKEVCTIIE
ncbi:DHH family phosphoesterase [Candidatus Hodarchaeum mangrovi]